MWSILLPWLQVRGQVETNVGRTFTQYKAITYAPQHVAGMNYFIKVGMESINLNT